jgi:hypothetical protein
VAGDVSSDPQPYDEQRITRNWDELLQEIRVSETGIQILTGFLLTVPFSNRFETLDEFQRDAYLVVLCGSVLTTALVVAPAAFHRMLFRQGARPWLVEAADHCARAGLALMAMTISGVLFLAFDVVAGRTPAFIALFIALAAFAVLWGLTPLLRRASR